MLSSVYGVVRNALFALEPEAAHEATLKALECGVYPRAQATDDSILAQRVFGLDFASPVGIAAGFDKDARVPDAVLGMGCGFAEVGTVTPKPQSGNPQPRVFRLINDQGLINRLGFNNGGHAAALERLDRRRSKGGIVGVNIGANKDASDRSADYVQGIETFHHIASYFTVNISSPNTPGLRDLQAPAALDELLGRIMAARSKMEANSGVTRRPIIVKIAPDISEDDIPDIVDRLLTHRVDGIAISNTTLSRAGLTDVRAGEAGGVSGRPVFNKSTAMLARIYSATNGKVPLIGIGGIDSPEAALAKIEAGATLLQLYTGLIYQGPPLIGRIKAKLAQEVRAVHGNGLASIRGRKADVWARMPLA
jgi:dihydroorotate dehydrogenase